MSSENEKTPDAWLTRPQAVLYAYAKNALSDKTVSAHRIASAVGMIVSVGAALALGFQVDSQGWPAGDHTRVGVAIIGSVASFVLFLVLYLHADASRAHALRLNPATALFIEYVDLVENIHAWRLVRSAETDERLNAIVQRAREKFGIDIKEGNNFPPAPSIPPLHVEG